MPFVIIRAKQYLVDVSVYGPGLNVMMRWKNSRRAAIEFDTRSEAEALLASIGEDADVIESPRA